VYAREDRQNKKASAYSSAGAGPSGGKQHAVFRKRDAEIAKKRRAANE
jgi:hypothetical protein